MILIAELATGHGGSLTLAEEMMHAAAEAGCTHVKTQAYDVSKLNPRDPQYGWLQQSALWPSDHERLMRSADEAGVAYLATPFDHEILSVLRELGLKQFKIASSESGNDWWRGAKSDEQWFVSYPWGQGAPDRYLGWKHTRLTAIPLYPTPLEVAGRATLLDGWSDHGEGIDACLWAIAKGCSVIEAHLTIPGARHMLFDKTPEQFREIRRFLDQCETIRTGVAQKFRERWTA